MGIVAGVLFCLGLYCLYQVRTMHRKDPDASALNAELNDLDSDGMRSLIEGPSYQYLNLGFLCLGAAAYLFLRLMGMDYYTRYLLIGTVGLGCVFVLNLVLTLVRRKA
jgi:hypothetical protein